VDEPEFTLVGLQVREETSVGATRLKVAAWDEPFKVAVTVALWLVVIVPRVAVKFAEVLLAGTVTAAGTVSVALLVESATMAPPAGAGWFKVTVQVLEPPDRTLAGLQLRSVKATGMATVMVPALPVRGMGAPGAAAAMPFVTLMDVALEAGERVAVTTATVPFWMMLALSPLGPRPVSMQV